MDDPYGLRSLDLDRLRRRRGAKWTGRDARFSAWVADMDFEIAPAIAEALREVIDRHELGYPNWGGPYARSPAARLFPDRMSTRYGWEPEETRVHDLVDVLQGVRATIHHRSSPGDGVVLHVPAYHPFLDTIESMARRRVDVRWTGEGFDYDDLEARLGEDGATIWILCHPHNPLGHVFRRRELERIADIAARHDILVVSDEIHADLTMPGATHVPFASLGPEVVARTVTVTSTSKAFNLAGLRWAVMHAGDAGLHDALEQLPGHYLGAPNVMAVTAAVAAWTGGGEWLDAVVDVIDENRQALGDLLRRHLPGTVYRPPEATYLAWVDATGLGLGDDPAETFRRRGVELSPGPQFGPGGEGHVRINIATSPAILAETVAAMAG
jgi:cysteine-S-conjugate beta-lyase